MNSPLVGWDEVAAGVFHRVAASEHWWTGSRQAMEASGLPLVGWLPKANMKRPPRRMFAHAGLVGESWECRAKGRDFGRVWLVLRAGGDGQQRFAARLSRAALGDAPLQQFLRQAAKLDLVQGEEG